MKKYWKSIENKNIKSGNTSHVNRNKSELKSDDNLLNLISEEVIESKSNRRDFLKYFGFSIASAAVIAGCEQPVRKAIPYLIRPESVTPGIASYYASSYYDGNEYCSILIKVRDGRPVKIEGNELSKITQGATSARVQASLLGLYDDNRIKHPSIGNTEVSWDKTDAEIIRKLEQLSSDNEDIVLLSSSIISPSTLSIIDELKKKYKTLRHITYDSISASALIYANFECFDIKALPSYHFNKAELIVSINADFLGTWLSPVEFTKQFSTTRSLTGDQKKISKLIHFESNMSLTGSNADQRVRIKPSEQKGILIALYNEVARLTGNVLLPFDFNHFEAKSTAVELVSHKNNSLVICGNNDIECQILVNGINYLLGNYGTTLDFRRKLNIKQGNDSELVSLIEDIWNNKTKGLILYNVNPVYDSPYGEIFTQALQNMDLSVSLSSVTDESGSITKYNCPDHHFLESWNDAEIYTHLFSLAQPVIKPLFNTRQAQDSLLKWAGNEMSYYDYIKTYWEKNILRISKEKNFKTFWNKSLHDGIFEPDDTKQTERYSFNKKTLEKINPDKILRSEEIELNLYEPVSIGDGRLANNPWLQELPDPVTKVTWDNYAMISPVLARRYSLKTGDVIKINNDIKIPVFIQPGQENNTVGIALGYGRTKTGKVAKGLGRNMYSCIEIENDYRKYHTTIKISKTEEKYILATTQQHHSMEGRAIIRNASLDEYLKNPSAGNEMHKEVKHHLKTIYQEHKYPGHHWGMSIDLNKCIGCNACVAACTVENNIPVVGKEEVKRAHEMHWIRIDRYYEGEEENPKTLRQPVLCQHCDNAPCENVCPVAATNHSDEGINQMAYNRCIGTRYCNNNCPYKVRRFNWFDYNKADALNNNEVDPAGMTVDLKRMVLNPDVTVRAKGVIEKCSFCIQRIQEKKLQAKLENRKLEDGEIKTACMQVCPSDAIVFGDLNDAESKVSKLFKEERNYHLLEELHTLPSVGYLTKISNNKE